MVVVLMVVRQQHCTRVLLLLLCDGKAACTHQRQSSLQFSSTTHALSTASRSGS
jgi:hypothetical protein